MLTFTILFKILSTSFIQWIICVRIGNNRIRWKITLALTVQKPKLNIYEREILCAPSVHALQKGMNKTTFFFFFLLLNARIKYRIMILLCANGSVNGMNKHNDELKLTSLLFFFSYREITVINDEFLAKMRCFQLESSLSAVRI